MRTFELKATSRFWAIERQGKTVTIRYGKIGGKPVARATTAANHGEALQSYQRLIAAKIRDGYVETTADDVQPLGSTGEALEAALVEDPDDLAAHMAFADWLSEQHDPRHQARAEFIRVQLQLEDESLAAAQRKKLAKREKELLADNERRWMGWRLADMLFDGGGGVADYAPADPGKLIGYRRGWIDRVRVPMINTAVAEALSDAPSLRLLRELVIENGDYSQDELAVLVKFKHLGNLRKLRIDDVAHSDHLDAFVARLPHLEELHIEALEQNIGKLFALETLGNLRRLHVAEAAEYDIKALAKNPHLGKLTHLALLPDWTQTDHGPHIDRADFRALVRSKHLTSLTHLTVHRTNAGDSGIDELVASGLLGRLVELDLSHGCVTDQGALALAAAPGFARLEALNLSANRLTRAGCNVLKRKGLRLNVEDQQRPDEDGEYRDGYLYDDDWDIDSDFEDDWE